VPQFTDAYARSFYYLRLSVTDVCNFRCTYCLPNGYKPNGTHNKSFLSLDEIRRVTRAFAAAGTEKVRLTGGEPSMRRDFTDIIAAVRENAAIRQIAMTTNGYRMALTYMPGALPVSPISTSASIASTHASFTPLPARTNLPR